MVAQPPQGSGNADLSAVPTPATDVIPGDVQRPSLPVVNRPLREWSSSTPSQREKFNNFVESFSAANMNIAELEASMKDVQRIQADIHAMTKSLADFRRKISERLQAERNAAAQARRRS